VCTAGQPTDAALQDLAKEGFRTILNLRTAQEGVDVVAEGQLVEKLGMRYIHIPVNPKAIQDSQVEEFLRVVSDSNNAPMLLHCASANRIGGFWLIYRVLKDGWSVEKAEEEAARVGLSSAELKRFALDYIVRNRQP
jgi:uncharacterized protein (TIGR01244 family)